MNRGAIAWAAYDWAVSAVSTIVFTFVFATYFATEVYGDEQAGQAALGYALSLYGVVVLIGAPILGAIADRAGPRKPWIFGFTLLCVVSCIALWFVEPDESWVFFALLTLGLANVGFEFATVFYNAMLPSVSTPDRIGRTSGWAWGLGYIGGVVGLGLTLVVFINPDPAVFGLDRDAAEHVRATSVFAGVWLALFALPLFFLTPDAPRSSVTMGEAVRAGLRQLWHTLRHARDYPDLLKFLIGSAIYRDGLSLLFAFGGVYAASKYGMGFDELVIFAIGLNLTAGIGAASFAILDDRIGSRLTILLSLVLLCIFGSATLLAPDKAWFMGFGLALGAFVGPAQAAGRTMVARLSPPEMTTEMYGLYAMTGRGVAVLGPLLLGLATDAFGQTTGMFTILVLWIVGGAITWFVREPETTRAATRP